MLIPGVMGPQLMAPSLFAQAASEYRLKTTEGEGEGVGVCAGGGGGGGGGL